MPASNRPEKRVLVRWSDDLDKQLLLSIQYACQEDGVRIPFDRVAQIMGPKFSPGAIVQHLAKLRTKMVETGLAVPPPMKKGVALTTASKVYAVVPKKRKASTRRGTGSGDGAARDDYDGGDGEDNRDGDDVKVEDEDEEDAKSDDKGKVKAKAKAKRKAVKVEGDDNEWEGSGDDFVTAIQRANASSSSGYNNTSSTHTYDNNASSSTNTARQGSGLTTAKPASRRSSSKKTAKGGRSGRKKIKKEATSSDDDSNSDSDFNHGANSNLALSVAANAEADAEAELSSDGEWGVPKVKKPKGKKAKVTATPTTKKFRITACDIANGGGVDGGFAISDIIASRSAGPRAALSGDALQTFSQNGGADAAGFASGNGTAGSAGAGHSSATSNRTGSLTDPTSNSATSSNRTYSAILDSTANVNDADSSSSAFTITASQGKTPNAASHPYTHNLQFKTETLTDSPNQATNVPRNEAFYSPPAMHTRRVRPNYAEMEGNGSEDDDEDVEEEEVINEGREKNPEVEEDAEEEEEDEPDSSMGRHEVGGKTIPGTLALGAGSAAARRPSVWGASAGAASTIKGGVGKDKGKGKANDASTASTPTPVPAAAAVSGSVRVGSYINAPDTANTNANRNDKNKFNSNDKDSASEMALLTMTMSRNGGMSHSSTTTFGGTEGVGVGDMSGGVGVSVGVGGAGGYYSPMAFSYPPTIRHQQSQLYAQPSQSSFQSADQGLTSIDSSTASAYAGYNVGVSAYPRAPPSNSGYAGQKLSNTNGNASFNDMTALGGNAGGSWSFSDLNEPPTKMNGNSNSHGNANGADKAQDSRIPFLTSINFLPPPPLSSMSTQTHFRNYDPYSHPSIPSTIPSAEVEAAMMSRNNSTITTSSDASANEARTPRGSIGGAQEPRVMHFAFPDAMMSAGDFKVEDYNYDYDYDYNYGHGGFDFGFGGGFGEDMAILGGGGGGGAGADAGAGISAGGVKDEELKSIYPHSHSDTLSRFQTKIRDSKAGEAGYINDTGNVNTTVNANANVNVNANANVNADAPMSEVFLPSSHTAFEGFGNDVNRDGEGGFFDDGIFGLNFGDEIKNESDGYGEGTGMAASERDFVNVDVDVDEDEDEA